MEYQVEKLTAAELARLSPDLREQVEQLRTDIADLRKDGLADDPDFAREITGSDTDLYELALGELNVGGIRFQPRTSRYQPPAKANPLPVETTPAKPGRPAREKRAKKEHPAYTGPAVDRDGHPVAVGDTVEAEVGGRTVMATVINLKRHEGGGHQVKYRGEDGKWKTPMVAPEKIRKADAAPAAGSILDRALAQVDNRPLPAAIGMPAPSVTAQQALREMKLANENYFSDRLRGYVRADGLAVDFYPALASVYEREKTFIERNLPPKESGTPLIVAFKEALPAGLVRTAIVADRTDCDENKVILVEPTEKVLIDAPMVADPAKGDKILVHPDGTAMTVVKGAEVDKHFEATGKAKVEKKKDGTVEFDTEAARGIQDASHPGVIAFNALAGAAEENAKMEKREKRRAGKPAATPSTAPQAQPDASEDEEEKMRDKTPYSAVKRAKPTSKCEFNREKAKSPALVTFLEGMRLRWHDGETKDKIVGVYWLNESKEVVLKIKVYDWLDMFSDVRFFTVCPARAKLKRIDKPRRGTYKVLFSEEAMKDFYRYPNDSSCRRVARALFVECYRNGGCSDERQKRLYTIFVTKCSRQEKAHSREYLKYTHGKTSERWKGYEGDKTYPEIYREVLAEIRKKK